MRLSFLGWAIALLLWPSKEIFAQVVRDSVFTCSDNCCCDIAVAPPAGVMISHVHRKGEWMLSYRLMNSATDGLLSGSSAIAANSVFTNYLMLPSSAQMNMHMFMAMYGVSNKLTLMTMFNYNSMSMEMAIFSNDAEHNHSSVAGKNNVMQTAGFGDVKVQALYDVLNSNKQQLVFSLGASLPSGNISLQGNSNDLVYTNSRLPYSMQMGSGTVDALTGISYMYHNRKIATGAQSTAVFRTYNNSVGYHLGNEYSLQAWMAYKYLNFLSTSVRAEYSVVNKISGKDASLYVYNEPSANPDNYGGQKLTLYLGSTWQIGSGIFKNNQLGVEYGLPVYQYVQGIQPRVSSFLYASWAFTF
ncbi:MAG: transporter [Bacteroidetes bacterium]|nr:transporter [Bacteroidota bacterium]